MQPGLAGRSGSVVLAAVRLKRTSNISGRKMVLLRRAWNANNGCINSFLALRARKGRCNMLRQNKSVIADHSQRILRWAPGLRMERDHFMFLTRNTGENTVHQF